jgi:hypothetical protein
MNITFDGIDATGVQNQAQKQYIRLAIPTTAIAEFRADSMLSTAEFGNAGGAQIALASASGSNSFHTSLFEDFRNSDFDARTPFDRTSGPQPFHMNQFGGNIGGPLRKNRIFFFFNYEGLRQSLDQTLIGFVPSAALKSQIDAKAPALASILNDYPVGNGAVSSNGIQQYTGIGSQFQTENSETLRVDDHFSNNTTGYLRFSYDDAVSIVPLGVLTDRQKTDTTPLNGVAELLHVFSPSLVGEFKFGVNQALYHTDNLTPIPYSVIVPGLSTLNSAKTVDALPETFSWLGNISKVSGRHVIKAGGEIRRIAIDEGNSFDGTLTYSTLANFTNNTLDQAVQIALLPLKRMRKTSYYGYVQDEYRVRPNLTVNAGLRYEFYNTFHETQNRDLPLDFETCGGFCKPTDPFLFPSKLNFDPRIGIAWSPLSSHSSMVVRAGYGIYHEDAQLDDQNFPIANDEARYTLIRGTQFPNLTYPFDSLLSAATGVFTPKAQTRNRKDAYVQQWTFAVQKTLPKFFTGTVSYLGSKGTDIMNRSYINLLNPGTGTRPYPQFGQIELRANNGNSTFEALQTALQRPVMRGLLLSVNYMWSHSIDDGSLGSGVEDDFPQNVNCRACDRASSDQDARQSFSAFAKYELPFGKEKQFLNQPGLFSTVFGGWQLNSIAGGRTGLPVNIVMTRSAASTPDGNSTAQRPDYVGGVSVVPAVQTPNAWINLAAFNSPASGTWGNLGRNIARGPALWQADTAISRRIALGETRSLEIRGECFNLLNRPQYGNPSSDVAAPSSFGRITSLVNTSPTGSGTPREFQVSLRLAF